MTTHVLGIMGAFNTSTRYIIQNKLLPKVHVLQDTNRNITKTKTKNKELICDLTPCIENGCNLSEWHSLLSRILQPLGTILGYCSIQCVRKCLPSGFLSRRVKQQTEY